MSTVDKSGQRPPETGIRPEFPGPATARIRRPDQRLERRETAAANPLRPVHYKTHPALIQRTATTSETHPLPPRFPVHPARPNRTRHPPNRTPKSARSRRLANRQHPLEITPQLEPAESHARRFTAVINRSQQFWLWISCMQGSVNRRPRKLFPGIPLPSRHARARISRWCYGMSMPLRFRGKLARPVHASGQNPLPNRLLSLSFCQRPRGSAPYVIPASGECV